MRLTQKFLILAAALTVIPTSPALSDTPSESAMTWECPQADGSPMYTNKERAGCHAMTLKPLSVVPDLENMPTAPRATTTAAPHYEVPPYQDRAPGMRGPNVSDWARDWHASIAASGSVQDEVCSLYSEWMHLALKTRGGLFFGSDPSYGGDVTGRNQRGGSYSFYDNARYVALSRLFGSGFVPIGCF